MSNPRARSVSSLRGRGGVGYEPATLAGAAGFAVVGVAFGMARFCYGLTLPYLRADLGLSELVAGLIASLTFVGYLAGLLLSGVLASARGPRAPITLGGVCGAAGCLLVAVAPTVPVLAVGAVLAGSAAGWVWSPYFDIVSRLAAAPARPALLARISTGISAGLALIGLLGLVTPGAAWRLTWGGVALAAAAATVLNLRWVPRLPPRARSTAKPGGGPLLRLSALRPLVFVVVAFAACTLYLIYAPDAVSAAGLGAAAGPVLYIVVGVCGLVGLLTSRFVRRLGAGRVAAVCLAAFGLALAILGGFSSSLPAVLISAALFGAAYLTGSAVFSIWTAQVYGQRAGAGFTALFLAGAAASIITPTLIGALLAHMALPTLLLVAAALAVATAVAVAGPAVRSTAVAHAG